MERFREKRYQNLGHNWILEMDEIGRIKLFLNIFPLSPHLGTEEKNKFHKFPK